LSSTVHRPALVVEDDRVIRYMLADLLSDEGSFDVTAATFDDLPAPQLFVVVVTDLAPGPYRAAGARTWVLLLRDRYQAPIIVCTGYAEASREPDRLGADALLIKPLDIAQLLMLADLLARDAVRPAPARDALTAVGTNRGTPSRAGAPFRDH
jgi:CheY-like chemotaxis protein